MKLHLLRCERHLTFEYVKPSAMHSDALVDICILETDIGTGE